MQKMDKIGIWMYVFQMAFFSFCRGSLGQPRINRTIESWETKTLKNRFNVEGFNLKLRKAEKYAVDKERKRHPFPSVELPPNCYICFSTLPDSK